MALRPPPGLVPTPLRAVFPSCYQPGRRAEDPDRSSSSVGSVGVFLGKPVLNKHPWRKRSGAPGCSLPGGASPCAPQAHATFYATFQENPRAFPVKQRIGTILLGEFALQDAAPARIEPHQAACIKRYRKRHQATKA